MFTRSALISGAGLAALAVVFFWKIALTNQIMVGVDIFTYFYPYRSAVNEALLHGRLPLWNPFLYMGVPLLANGQAGIFYPLNWLFIFLSPPLAINASVVLHIILAALFFHLFARDVLGLSELPAFIAASVYAFSGYVGSLVEHVNQLQAAVWFPLLVICVHRAHKGPRAPFVLMGGFVFALQLLAGHAQVSYITFAGLGLWLFGRQDWMAVRPMVLNRATARRFLAVGRAFVTDLAVLGAIGIAGVCLAAVQLVPMLELARLSIRAGGMTYREAVAFSLPPQRLLESLLPTFGSGEAISSEFIAFIGITALMLATVGALKNWRTHNSLMLLLLGGFLLALGLYDPLYFVLFKLVPGFGLFRVPARWIFLAVVPAAGFAGLGAQAVMSGWRPHLARRYYKSFAVVLSAVVVAGSVLAFAHILLLPAWPVPVAWVLVTFTVVLAIGAFARISSRVGSVPAVNKTVVGLAIGALVILELFGETRWLPYNQLTAPEAWSSLRPSIAFLLSDGSNQPFRILSYSDLTWDPGDLRDIEGVFFGQLSARAVYEYTVAAKAKEIVAPNLALSKRLQSVDGYDGGVLPLAAYVGLEGLILAPEQVNPDGRVRERLREPPAVRWLDLFNVRYLIADKVFDVWVDGIYYDLGMGLDLKAGDKHVYPIDVPANFTATRIGVISYLTGASHLPDDTPVAELLATDSHGTVHPYILRAGRETSESEYEPSTVAHAKARAVHTVRDQPQANEYHAQFVFNTPAAIGALSVSSLLPAGDVSLRGITLIDEISGTGKALTFARQGKFRIAQSGDVKIYERLDPSPRALVVHRAALAGTDAEALRQMSVASFDPGAQIVLAAGVEINSPRTATSAAILTYEDEHLVIGTSDPSEGYLLVKDAWYPGWHAWVDGQPAVIERADTYFRAIKLTAGPHTVEMKFEPGSLKVGALLSLAAVVAWVGAATWWLVSRRSRR